MFFTSVGRVLAFITVAFGGMRLVAGVVVAINGTPEAAARYLGSATSGAAIDQGIMTIGIGIALGILTDISRSLKR